MGKGDSPMFAPGPVPQHTGRRKDSEMCAELAQKHGGPTPYSNPSWLLMYFGVMHNDIDSCCLMKIIMPSGV